MYSDMSKRISERSLPNRKAASVRATSVLPTPVGPRKMNEPTGRLGFLSPARVRRMARATAEMALSCETMRLWSSSSMRSSLCDSSSLMAVIGMPVHFETTSSMSLLVTSRLPAPLMSQCSRRMCRFSRCATSSSRKNEPRSKVSPPRSTTTRILRATSGCRAGSPLSRSLTRLPASSSRSMALSGRKRSGM